jgi:hypothetical protein
MLKKIRMSVLALSGAGLIATANAQHAHLNAGAESWNQNSRMIFENGADFAAASGYVKTLVFTNDGTYANTFNGGITLTALHSTNAFGDPTPKASAPGSFVMAEIVSVQGPAGGHFAFWETNSTRETGAKYLIASGTTNAGARFDLSEGPKGAGEPGADPYGHIHGRRFSADKPGLYRVTFVALDASTNGVGGGPIHLRSEPLAVLFQAGVFISEIEPDFDHTHVHFGATAGFNWQLETSSLLGTNASWKAIGDPIVGDDLFHEVEHDEPVEGNRFYRIRGIVTP